MPYGGENVSYNRNPNMISLQERRERSEAFDKEIDDPVMNNPKAFRETLKNLSFALSRHDEATEALTNGRLVNVCFYLLRKIGELESRITALEEKCST